MKTGCPQGCLLREVLRGLNYTLKISTKIKN